MFKRNAKYGAGLPTSRITQSSSKKASLTYGGAHSRKLRKVCLPSPWSLLGYIWTAIGLFGFFYGLYKLLTSRDVVELKCPSKSQECFYFPPSSVFEKYSFLTL